MSQSPTTDFRQLRRVTSGKKRRVVRALRQRAERYRVAMLTELSRRPTSGARVR